LDDTSDSIYQLKDEITHITSVGDPWVMFNREKRGRTTQNRRKTRKESIKVYDPHQHKKDLK